jgi:pimeloyl-ACP methyl ester carboxylesterase
MSPLYASVMVGRRAFLRWLGSAPLALAVAPAACRPPYRSEETPMIRMTSGMQTVTAADGTPIAYRRSGSGPPLLLVHGTTADHTRWAGISPALETHFTVYAMDRRGRGASGDGPEYSLPHEGEDVVAVVDALGEPVNLLGHSYGALCALEGAMRTSSIRTLILYEPPLPGGEQIVPPETLARLDGMIARGEREAALITFFREVVGVPESQMDAVRSHPAWPGRLASAHTLGRETRVEAEYALDLDRLRTVRTPTLFLLGGASPPAFHTATHRLHAALPMSRIHVLEGQQHMAMDTAPEAFVDVVRQFALAGGAND